MGGPSVTDWFRALFSPSRCCRSRRRTQSKPDRDRYLCAAHQQSQVGGGAPGNVVLGAKTTGLAKDSVANVSQILTLDRGLLTECAGKVSKARVQLILAGLDVVLGR